MEQTKLIPVLKWAGGKRQLLNRLLPLFPKDIKTYIEPFLGGASVFLSLKPKKAIVGDYNWELINIYETIKNSPNELIEELELLKNSHCEEQYYSIRNLDREEKFGDSSNIFKAARTIYLNHTCYNGLFRVNQKGYFNTPIGKYKSPAIYDEENIFLLYDYFNNNHIDFLIGDYKQTLAKAKEGDFVYLDPPYDPISKNSFIGYTNFGFSKKEQILLKEQCDKLTKKGIRFIQSNSNTEFIKELYKDYDIIEVDATRCINSKTEGRSKMKEVIIKNY